MTAVADIATVANMSAMVGMATSRFAPQRDRKSYCPPRTGQMYPVVVLSAKPP